MTMAACMLYALAAVVFLAVMHRLALLQRSHPTLRCRFTWNLWVLGQVDIAVGALAVLLGRPSLALGFLLIGLALQLSVRPSRKE